MNLVSPVMISKLTKLGVMIMAPELLLACLIGCAPSNETWGDVQGLELEGCTGVNSTFGPIIICKDLDGFYCEGDNEIRLYKNATDKPKTLK